MKDTDNSPMEQHKKRPTNKLSQLLQRFIRYRYLMSEKITLQWSASQLMYALFVAILLGMLGVFDFDKVSWIKSMLFWILACSAGVLIYPTSLSLGFYWLKSTRFHWVVKLSFLLISAGLILSIFVATIAYILFDWMVSSYQDLFLLMTSVVILGGIIHMTLLIKEAFYWQIHHFELKTDIASNTLTASTSTTNTSEYHTIPLMSKLPQKIQAPLICIECQDHYLKIYTQKGHYLLLMRFKDALKELSHYPGIQTHRSWWVANEAVESTIKENRRYFLKLKNNLLAPVSKSFQASVKAASLLES